MAIDPSSVLLTGRVAVVTGGGAGIGRGVAEGLAGAAVFLASDMSSYITGQTIHVHGGTAAAVGNRIPRPASTPWVRPDPARPF